MYPNQPDTSTYNAFANVPDSNQAPKSNVGWAVAAVVFFWPLAFSAFTHSSNVYPLWATGDITGAQHASARARKLGLISLAISVVVTIATFVLYAVLVAWIMSNPGSSY